MIYFLISNVILVGIAFLVMFKFFNTRFGEQQLELLSVLISTKSHYVYGHQEHVAAIVNIFYYYLPKEIRKKVNRKKLVKAAKMHDVGKLFIVDDILNKPGKLTEEEYDIIKSHAAIGAGILDKTFHREISNFVLCHHEWINGQGYYQAE